MKNLMKIFVVSTVLLSSFAYGCETHSKQMATEQARIIAVIDAAQSYIKKYGREKSIDEFKKNHDDIFMADYQGNFYVSPLHPELIGHNQFNYKDPSGTYAVQQEINKAKAGGGWLKGRLRQDPKTGQKVCRKIYIRPIGEHYFIGSWYHYPLNKQGKCVF